MKGDSEIELVAYAQVGNPAGLKLADRIEKHIQLEARLLDGNKVRVRKTIARDNAETIEFTAKRKNPNQDAEGQKITDTVEFTAPATQEIMDAFEHGAMEQKLIKTRYYFKNKSITLKVDNTETPIVIDDVGFEVDIFTPREDKPSEWVKIDVEVDKILAHMDKYYPDIQSSNLFVKFSGLPFKPKNVILQATANDKQKEFIDSLWKNEFVAYRK